ncbi:type IV pilus biogenesis/stability protein PilW [Bergeriella denitrificans]|uniref:Lipoprotein n=1 Tax=Bergeriella denitrificans TaxID=494 RepID=A0A378UEV9_BERDE|nr:type IV pilus biogenesis/stability protein PilW [Bergeriella denitrificans]STZ75876.1 lipoprotein [Bergeriella denitrificans]
MAKSRWLALLPVCLIAACANPLGSEARARATQVSDIKTQLALEYMRTQNYRQATASIEEALAADSRNENAWLVRAEIYQFLKVGDKAQESFQKALAIQPDRAETNNNYGWFLCSMQNRPAEAIAYFDKALADPTYPTPYVAQLNKGICSAKSGQFALADAYFERALAADAGFYPVFKAWARVKMQQGRLNEALDYFRRYESAAGSLPAEDLLLGWQIYRAAGDILAADRCEAELESRFPYSEELQTLRQAAG